jgi:hypothetical protein
LAVLTSSNDWRGATSRRGGTNDLTVSHPAGMCPRSAHVTCGLVYSGADAKSRERVLRAVRQCTTFCFFGGGVVTV